MVTGVCTITLLIHGNNSLKGKRHVLKGLMEKVKNRFNVSIAEVGCNDLWQRAEIGISAVGTDNAFVNSVLDKVFDYVVSLNTAEVIDRRMEIINF